MSFEFFQPGSLPEALEVLQKHSGDAKVIAGGTAVVLMLQQKLIAPAVLVSLDRIPDLYYVRQEDGRTYLGPLLRIRDVAQDLAVRKHLPALAVACDSVGNIRVRNQATLGGNLAEADYASDPPAVLLALDASATLTGVSRSRSVSLADFFLGFYTTALEPDELITEIVVPPFPSETRMTYVKFKSRSSEDRPCVGVAAVASFDGEICTDLRVAIGAASEVPARIAAFEQLAHGQKLTDDLIVEIAEGYASEIDPLDDLRGSAWYRTQMIRVHVRRALMEVRNGSR